MKKPDNITKLDWELLKTKHLKIDNKIINKINKGYPIQYLIGDVDFFDCLIKVNKHVLIPRFETESLVEKAIKEIKEHFDKKLRIIDFGTGSGCIAIKLAKEFDNSEVFAIDKSKKAIKLAKENAKINNVNISFFVSKFDKFKEKEFDILISNPPYIAKNGEISDNVKKYEPKTALFAKENGLFYYDQILNQAKKILNKRNIIFFEIGYNQKDNLTEIIKKHYPLAKIKFDKDYNKMDRFCTIYNNIGT